MRDRLRRYIIGTSLLTAFTLVAYLAAAYFFIGKPAYRTLIGLTLALILGSVTFYKYGPGVRTATKTMQGWWMLAPLMAIISLAYFSVFVILPQGLGITDMTSAGAVFVVVMAIVTVGGFLLTVTRLEEIHGRILSYPHLLERIDVLIDMEAARLKKGKKNPGRLYILANAPAVGNVSAPHEFQQLLPELKRLLNDSRVEVKLACLPWKQDFAGTSAIERFYEEHWASLTTKRELNSKIAESIELIRVLQAAAKGLHTEGKEVYQLTVHEAPFHLFLTSERAILFTALSFPDYISDALDGEAEPEREDLREVKVIGFETGDRSILNALRKGFERRMLKIALKDPSENVALSGQTHKDQVCTIEVDSQRRISGLVRYGGDRFALLCRGLTDSSSRHSGIDELADVLEKRCWSSLRFDYSNSLTIKGNDQLRTAQSMVRDFSQTLQSLSQCINQSPDVIIARGYGCRIALEGLASDKSQTPLIMWAPILWLRTAFEIRARLHELRKNGSLVIDGVPIAKEFVENVVDPTNNQLRAWVTPRRYFIVQAEDDTVTTVRLVSETKQLIESAGGAVEVIKIPGLHPHPGMDVTPQLKKIIRVLARL